MKITMLYSFLLAFAIGLVVAPFVIFLAKKFKFGQTILEYVKEHIGKQGTPTMGGLIFIIASTVTSLILFKKDSSLALVCVFVMLAFGVLGFLDDFIKIKFKQNIGLKPYQKIIGQVGISLIVAIFCYTNKYIGSSVIVPFTDLELDLGVFIIPFIMFVYIALVNSVNLLDGLDGLCGGVSFVSVLSFGILILFFVTGTGTLQIELSFISQLCFVFCGALFSFLCFNVFPAKIFMGDTGSLAIGGLLTSIAVFSKTELYILIFGILYVITAVSDIIQVLYYKKTKKRIFLMAPLHHHFQKKNMHENKIVFVYIVISAIISLLTFLFLLIL